MGMIKKAGISIIVLIGIAIMLISIFTNLNQKGRGDLRATSSVSAVSANSGVYVDSGVSSRVKEYAVVGDSRAESSNGVASQAGATIFYDIPLDELKSGSRFTDNATVIETKTLYNNGQVLYELIMKMDSHNVTLKYFVSFSTFKSYGVNTRLSVTVNQYLDSKGNTAYAVESISQLNS